MSHYNSGLECPGQKAFPGLKEHPVEYFGMLYNETTLNGSPSSLRCAYDFFGEDRLLLGSDMPYDIENGAIAIRKGIEEVEGMDVPESTRKKIYEDNARRLLHL